MPDPGSTGIRTEAADAKNYRQGNVPYRDRVYAGRVTHADPETGRVDVELDAFNNYEISNCVPMTPVFAAMVGFRMRFIPPVGSRVLVLYVRDDLSYVMGSPAGSTIPDNQAGQGDNESGVVGLREKVDAYEEMRDPEDPFLGTGYEQDDLLEGEFDLSNALGVGIVLLTSLAKLKAGDRAKVEACCHNDMVKMVSGVFRHFSAVGLQEIYSDGARLNAVWDGTSYDHEAWGLESADDPKDENLDERGVPLDDPVALRHTIRARFSQYLGHLGDFIHGFVTDPMDALEDFGEAAAPRAGKMRYHVGNDGNLLVQSVADITFERTHRIPVPVKKKEWHEPAAEGEANPALRYLRTWRYQSPQTRFHAAYQLREYARWLSGAHGYARFLEHPRWEVPTEAETPEPSRDAGETDRAELNAADADEQGYIEAYACFRIMRDGSIVSYGGDRTAVVQARGSIQLSAPVNISLYAGQDINMVAGQDINVKARRHLELSAIVGGIKQKAHTWFHTLCERGSMLWESNAEPEPPESEEGTADHPDPEVRDHAILIKAGRGTVRMQGRTGASLQTEQGDMKLAAAAGDVKIRAGGDVDLRARSHLRLRALRDIFVVGLSFMANLSAGAGLFSVNNRLNLRSGTLSLLAQVRAKALYSLNIVTHDGLKRGRGPHPGHVGSMDREALENDFAPEELPAEEPDDPWARLLTYQSDSLNLDLPEFSVDTFEYRDPTDYGSDEIDPDLPATDMEPLTSQDIRLDGDPAYGTWGPLGESLAASPGVRINPTYINPWPGAGRTQLKLPTNTPAGSFSEPESRTYESIAPESTPPQGTPLRQELTLYPYKRKEPDE